VKEAVLFVVAGALSLLVVFGARLLERLPLSNSVVYLATGVLLGASGLVSLGPVRDATVVEHLADHRGQGSGVQVLSGTHHGVDGQLHRAPSCLCGSWAVRLRRYLPGASHPCGLRRRHPLGDEPVHPGHRGNVLLAVAPMAAARSLARAQAVTPIPCTKRRGGHTQPARHRSDAPQDPR